MNANSISIPIQNTARPTAKTTAAGVQDPSPAMYLTVFAVWLAALVWFQPRMWQLLDLAYSWQSKAVLLGFILFIDFAWLYGIFNVCVVGFAFFYKQMRRFRTLEIPRVALVNHPPVAILYTTCNDFVEESVRSCVEQDYPNFTVYILDDSSDDDYKMLVDSFAERFPNRVKVVRRPDRKAFKAGNMNHGLEKFAHEPYFAIADADEILPTDFLKKLVPVMEADPKCGFVQANHRANPNSKSPLAKDLGVGIDLHWEWYQPLRNDFGFVMFLGHGALLRRDVWQKIGGFPDIVSEDLGFAIHARELGYRGRFVEDVICLEDFPDTVRSFRVRHMKWTRGTSEFLKSKMRWLLRAKKITWTEKFDILFPTLNLPLTLLYFLFMVNANLLLPYFFGEHSAITFVVGGQEHAFPVLLLNEGFKVMYDADFFAITMLTFFAPVLCFILGMWRTPLKLYKFLSHSTALYAALGPLSTLGVAAYSISGKAIFLVTGGNQKVAQTVENQSFGFFQKLKNGWKKLLLKSHPDTAPVQIFEILTGVFFGAMCIWMFQISFFGLCLAFVLLPVMHHLGWEHRWSRRLVHLPFFLILMGVLLAGMSLFGMAPVFFGYGFHF